jgi:hypothetical protein
VSGGTNARRRGSRRAAAGPGRGATNPSAVRTLLLAAAAGFGGVGVTLIATAFERPVRAPRRPLVLDLRDPVVIDLVEVDQVWCASTDARRSRRDR